MTDRLEPASSVGSAFNLRYVWGISLAAALGGLLFGYDWVVIGGAKPFFERYFELTEAAQKGWANSCALLGCLVGALIAGASSDRFGRKRLLIFSAALFMATSIGNGLAGSFAAFVAWRLAGGVAIGLASNLSPMYIAEVAPASMRGRLVSINQLTIVIGIVLAQCVNWLIAESVPADATEEFLRQSWNCRVGWRWMFAATAAPACGFLLSVCFVPESPRWLVKNGQHDRARDVLERIGGGAYAQTAVRDIEATLIDEIRRVDFRELFEPKMLKILGLGVVLAVYQQWCGINVIFNYAEEVFTAAGYGVSQVLFQIVITGAVFLVFTFVAIGTVDRWGRRALMLAGSAGLALNYLLIGAAYHAGSRGVHIVVFVVAAIACYAFSLAPVVWVVLSEIFPNRIRGAAMSVAVMSLWVGCFALTYSFPFLNRGLGPGNTFWLYAAICLGGFIFVRKCLPETKGKTLEQIERTLL